VAFGRGLDRDALLEQLDGVFHLAIAQARWAYGFSVSPDERWILYAQPEPTTTDLMLVENFH